jgi:hypothetical protein
MRPTIEWAYWSGDFETVEAQKARTRQGRGIATRVTKGGMRGCRPRIASRVGAGSDGGGRSRRENSDGFIHDVGTPTCSLRVRSSSDGLGRPRGLGSQLRE